MGTWSYPTTRWAVYLRDGLRCGYCGVTLADILADYGDNFLTLDHVVPLRPKKGGRTGDNHPRNLVTACYHCNCAKGRDTVTVFARSMGWNARSVRRRVARLRARDVEAYRSGAKVLLGQVPGVPLADLVHDHDWLVRRQWREGDLDGQYWAHVREYVQETMFCETCRRPHATPDEQRAAAYGRWGDGSDIPF